MTIERNVNGTVVTLKIVGRLDTSTAPALEAAVDGCAADILALKGIAVVDLKGGIAVERFCIKRACVLQQKQKRADHTGERVCCLRQRKIQRRVF